jgi:polysaccharide export outer membrane protein
MRNKDVIYIANARSVESSKFISYVRLINAAVQDPINIAISSYALKSAILGTSTNSLIVGTIGPH